MNPIQALKHHNEWRRGSDTEMLNPTKLGKAIDTVIADYESMQKQNDELRAKLVNLAESKSCATCNNTGSHDYDDGFGGVCSSPCHCTNNPYSTYSIISSTTTQSLADIRAEAVLSLISSELGHSVENGCFSSDWVYTADEVKDHANRIKEG